MEMKKKKILEMINTFSKSCNAIDLANHLYLVDDMVKDSTDSTRSSKHSILLDMTIQIGGGCGVGITGSIFMKALLNKVIIISYIIIASITFNSCKIGRKEYYVTPAQLLNEFNDNYESANSKYKKAKIYVSGEVVDIEYPKDGFYLNDKCTIALGVEQRRSLVDTNDSVHCRMKKRGNNSLIGKSVVIFGSFDKSFIVMDKRVVLLKNCEIVE